MRVVVAEDHSMFRDVLVSLCREFEYSIVGATGNGREALSLCLNNHVDLLLLDMLLDDLPGGAVLDAIEGRATPPALLVISSCLGDYLTYRLEQFPRFVGFLDKTSATLVRMREALCAVASGSTYYSAQFRDARAAFHANPMAFNKMLTPREVEFLRHAAGEVADEDIGARMGISVRTVENRRSIILQKLGLHGPVQLLAYARRLSFYLFPAVSEAMRASSSSREQS